MSPDTRRYVYAAVLLAVLAGVIVWQRQREAQMRACLDTGGDWNGAQSACRYPGGRILIRPDMKRV